ncbi:MAG: hypothetical protein L6R42_007810 [Xanthoria sp. 1 TBL-2021]|nr:MAG: hypothetical protein L6R42_007810 [Xanthoria sp. 1 TBL-2021]
MNPAPWILDLGKQINSEILGRLSWIGIPTSPEDGSTDCNKKSYSFRLLDYACGEGVISRGIFDYVDEAWGIDLSARMVNSFNQRAAAFDVPNRKKMFAVQGDLLAPAASNDGTSFAGKEWFDFDLAIMTMALHHVPSPEDAVKMLVSRVKVGRPVLLVDWVAGTTVREEGVVACSGHGEHAHDVMPGTHTVTREGFMKDEVVKMLEVAGCVDVGFVEFGELSHLDFGEKRMWRRLFLAKGVKGGQ